MRGVAPIPNADRHIRLEPTVVPLLLRGRLKVDRVNVNAQFLQASIQQIALRRKPRRLWRIFVEEKNLHTVNPFSRNQRSNNRGDSKHQKASARGVVRASQLSGWNPYTWVIRSSLVRHTSGGSGCWTCAFRTARGRYCRSPSS